MRLFHAMKAIFFTTGEPLRNPSSSSCSSELMKLPLRCRVWAGRNSELNTFLLLTPLFFCYRFAAFLFTLPSNLTNRGQSLSTKVSFLAEKSFWSSEINFCRQKETEFLQETDFKYSKNHTFIPMSGDTTKLFLHQKDFIMFHTAFATSYYF